MDNARDVTDDELAKVSGGTSAVNTSHADVRGANGFLDDVTDKMQEVSDKMRDIVRGQ